MVNTGWSQVMDCAGTLGNLDRNGWILGETSRIVATPKGTKTFE